MNKKLIKNIAILVLTPSAIAAVYFGYKFYRKKMDTPTDIQFDELVKAFSKDENGILAGMTPEIYNTALLNFKKNITKQDVEQLIAISKKEFASLSADEKIKILNSIQAIIGASSVRALKGT